MKDEMGVGGFYFGIDGDIKFDDGTEATFSSKLLDTSKVGDLEVGTIVPVRYDADLKHAALDIPKLEAMKDRRTTRRRRARCSSPHPLTKRQRSLRAS